MKVADRTAIVTADASALFARNVNRRVKSLSDKQNKHMELVHWLAWRTRALEGFSTRE